MRHPPYLSNAGSSDRAARDPPDPQGVHKVSKGTRPGSNVSRLIGRFGHIGRPIGNVWGIPEDQKGGNPNGLRSGSDFFV